jgi:CRISPR-associated protein Cas1
MAVVYVQEQGAVIHKRGERLLVTRDGVTLMDLPLLHIDQLVLVGNVQLTTPAATALLQREIDVVFLSQNYRFRGRLVGPGSRLAALRHAQLRAAQDPARSIAIARWIVLGKLNNQRTLLQRWLRQSPSPEARRVLEEAIRGITLSSQGASQAGDPDQLRGFEGKAGGYYFGALRALLNPAWGFQGRAYYPPPDPFNAALSFGYALLLKDMTASIQIVGLDPYIGFFHAVEYARPSLALDLMEEFRPILVDALVLRLIDQGKLTPRDFLSTGRSERPVELRPEACERLIAAYEQRIHTRIHYPFTGEKTTYRRCLELQARQLARVLLGQQERYYPFAIR